MYCVYRKIPFRIRQTVTFTFLKLIWIKVRLRVLRGACINLTDIILLYVRGCNKPFRYRCNNVVRNIQQQSELVRVNPWGKTVLQSAISTLHAMNAPEVYNYVTTVNAV